MYVGVKYIGGNASKEDTICNTGAVWAQGEVLNFEEASAKKLAVHTDSFLLVDMSPNVKTFANKATSTVDNYEPFPSLAGMDAEQIANLASVRYGIKIETEGREHQDVVFDALNRIKAASLRADATELGVKVLPVVSMVVTDEEYKRYIAEELVLVLVPAAKREPNELLVPVVHVATEQQSENIDKLRAIFDEISEVEGSKIVDNGSQALKDMASTKAENDDLPSLPELLASLSTKKELQEFAKENNVTYANSMTEAQLRAKLLRELTK